jgi:isopropylmalate/homocitrate/citramalate synthase
VHCHDDLGLVVANTLAGIMAGAEIADVAVNGLGDRAGNAPLEVVAAALPLLYGVDAGLALEALTPLSERFAQASRRALPPNKPVTGPDVFAHVLPTHVAAMRADPRAIQPFEAELVGNRQRLGRQPS